MIWHCARQLQFMKSIKWIFLALTFVPPLGLLAAAFVVQYVGLLFERWFFFVQANHPQNLYDQVVG